MANSIALVTAFRQIVDAVYKVESKTTMLDAMTQSPSFLSANAVKVMKIDTVGLGTYSRASGYPAGNITATWEEMALSAERGRAFTLDRMDDEESLGLLLGRTIREWMRAYVAPEIDAYRFAKYATGAGNVVSSGATLDADTIVAAIAAGKLALDEDEVPEEDRTLFITPSCKQFLETAIDRSLKNENVVNELVEVYNGMRVVMVPQSRFYTAITLDAGATASAGGYSSNGKDINFMIVHKDAVCQPIKLNQVKYFSPDVNQTSDGHLWQYRLYHDAFVYDNHVNGIYLHHKA
ncbi:MAG: hypothetical protein SVT56_01765 [Chloroflexota bacterium]|nr:hypothetical protein [Chloroflexota bacterium]